MRNKIMSMLGILLSGTAANAMDLKLNSNLSSSSISFFTAPHADEPINAPAIQHASSCSIISFEGNIPNELKVQGKKSKKIKSSNSDIQIEKLNGLSVRFSKKGVEILSEKKLLGVVIPKGLYIIPTVSEMINGGKYGLIHLSRILNSPKNAYARYVMKLHSAKHFTNTTKAEAEEFMAVNATHTYVVGMNLHFHAMLSGVISNIAKDAESSKGVKAYEDNRGGLCVNLPHFKHFRYAGNQLKMIMLITDFEKLNNLSIKCDKAAELKTDENGNCGDPETLDIKKLGINIFVNFVDNDTPIIRFPPNLDITQTVGGTPGSGYLIRP